LDLSDIVFRVLNALGAFCMELVMLGLIAMVARELLLRLFLWCRCMFDAFWQKLEVWRFGSWKVYVSTKRIYVEVVEASLFVREDMCMIYLMTLLS
jgi:hypothetical protein